MHLRVSNKGATTGQPAITEVALYSDTACSAAVAIPAEGGWDDVATACPASGCDLCSGWHTFIFETTRASDLINSGCHLALDGDNSTSWNPGATSAGQAAQAASWRWAADNIWMTIRLPTAPVVACVHVPSLGEGATSDQSWNGGLTLQTSVDGGATFTTLVRDDAAATAAGLDQNYFVVLESGGNEVASGLGGTGDYYLAETSAQTATCDLFTLRYDGLACRRLGLDISAITFHYFMSGNQTGKFRLFDLAGNLLWVQDGSQDEGWHSESVNVGSPAFSFEYRLHGGISAQGAIDHVTVVCARASPPPHPPPPPPPPGHALDGGEHGYLLFNNSKATFRQARAICAAMGLRLAEVHSAAHSRWSSAASATTSCHRARKGTSGSMHAASRMPTARMGRRGFGRTARSRSSSTGTMRTDAPGIRTHGSPTRRTSAPTPAW